MVERSPQFWPILATTASVGTALVLVAAKGVAWQQSGSVAILGSLADSLLDFVSSVVAWAGVRYAAQPADGNHRFGHGKAEAISSLIQLVLITGSAVFVLVESLQRLADPQPIDHADLAIQVMGFSLVLTVGLIAVQTLALRKTQSLATESDRAHYLGDVLGNAGTLLAILLVTQFGWFWADGMAGLVAAAFLFWSVVEIGRRALPQLMDEEIGPEDRERIRTLVMADGDVLGMHALRTRRAGETFYIQLHLELDGDLTLRETHRTTVGVEMRLRRAFPGAAVILHQDIFGAREHHDPFGQRVPGTDAT